MRPFFTVSVLLLAAVAARAEDPLVVMAAARTGHIEFFDANLSAVGSIGVNQLVESVSASPDGRRLYIAQESQKASGNCCGLFSLDLNTLRMCFLTAPALFGVPSHDGRFLFTQGDQGVDIFSARTLSRLPTMAAPGAYNLQPSPDGRWLLGVTNSPAPSVDIFDLKARAMVRRLPVPTGPVTGAWAGDRFYIFNYGYPGKGQLWSVKPEDTELPEARPITLPDLHGGCNEPVLLTMVGAPGRLFLAEAFGFKLDRRRACPDTPRGDIYAIDASTGQVEQLARSVHVNRMAVTPDGNDLYVLQSVGRSPQRDIGLLHIDTRDRHAFHNYANSPALEPGDWNLALAHIPPALVPHGHLRASISCSH
jgi:DNA-binding beta-propeller fold protein YncE